MINLETLGGIGFLYAFVIAALSAYSQYVVLRAGVFSMATAGFMAIGAYSVAIMSVRFGQSPLIGMATAIILATLCGLGIGMLVYRLRGVYQGIATLSFVLVLQQILSLGGKLTGGPFGISGIPLFAETSVLLLGLAGVLVVVVLVELSPIGREQAAIRIDEIAAASLGANVARSNLIAIAYSAALGGFAGGMMAGNQFAVDPSVFSFHLIITTLAAVIIGGYRFFLGPVFGSAIVVALPLLFSQYAILATTAVSLATIATLALAPNGVASLIRIDGELVLKLIRRRLLHSQAKNRLVLARHSGGTEANLVADKIARAYGSVKAVDGVSMSVRPGQIVGLIGPNGAGKTSVINLLAGLAALDSGKITLGDIRLEELPAYRVQRLGLARTFQACRLFHEHSVISNLLFSATAGRSKQRRREFPDAACAEAAIEFVHCAELADRRADSLPYAFQRRVEIARALAGEPKFLLLDEPAAGMTQSEAAELGDTLRTVAHQGIGVLVVDHNVPWILSLCDVVYVLHLGKIIAFGTPKEVRENPMVIAAYIGEHGTSGKHTVKRPAAAGQEG